MRSCNAAACALSVCMCAVSIVSWVQVDPQAALFPVWDLDGFVAQNGTRWNTWDVRVAPAGTAQVHIVACMVVFTLATTLEHGAAAWLLRGARVSWTQLELVQ